MSGFEGISWDVGVSTFTDIDEDGFPIIQWDAYGDAGCDPAHLHHTYGFFSRPRDPEVDDDGQPIQGQACNLLIGSDGSDRHALLLADPRYQNPVPLLEKGGAALYGINDGELASFYLIHGDDGTHQAYMPVGKDRAHQFTFGLDGNGEPTIELIHADGSAIVMFGGNLILKSPSGGAYVQISDDGITLNGNVQNYGGMSTGGPAGQSAITAAGMALILARLSKAFLPSTAAPLTEIEILPLVESASTRTTKVV